MKKIILLFLVLIKVSTAEAQFPFPQLQAGVYVDSSIASFAYTFPGYCDSLGTYDVIFSVDSNLAHLVTGVEIFAVITSVSPADSVSTTQSGILHVGDTLNFSVSGSTYTISSTTAGSIALELIVSGTPSVPFEFYPCDMYIICTLSDCANTCMASVSTPFFCTVDNFSGISEINGSAFSIRPNPAAGYFEISSSVPVHHEMKFQVLSIQGQEIKSEILWPGFKSNRINVEMLSNGLYFWKITDRVGFEQTGKLLLNKND